MKSIAIVVATKYGQSFKIANALASEFESLGVKTALLTPDEELGSFEAVIIGSPVYIGKFVPEVTAWTKKNLVRLNASPAGFFSVSLNAADKRPQARLDDDRLLREFLTESGLRPSFVASFGGKLAYTKYGWFKRWMMKRISASAGGPVDTSRDHEMTDWDQVRRFAQAFASEDRRSEFATERRLAPPGAVALA